MKATRILLISGVALLLAVFVVGIYIVPKLQSGSPATARQSDASRVSLSDVFLDATYATPEFIKRVKLEPYLQQWEGRAQPFLIGINTHVGTIADLDLRGKVLVEDSNGDRFPSLGTPVVLSEHHNMYLLVFPLVDNSGQPIFAAQRGHFRLVVNGVGKTAERVFEWKLPVNEAAPARTLASTLMLILGVVGALMVILSPCAIELTTYYTGIIAGVVSSAAIAAKQTSPSSAANASTSPLREKGRRIPPELRARILRNLAAFVAGFTILYIASGATVALMGQQLLGMQARLQAGASLKEVFCGTAPAQMNESITAVTPGEKAAHANHGPGFGSWTRYANWLGASFLIYFALKSVGVLKRGGQCFIWLAQIGRKFRMAIAAVVELVSPKRAAVIRAPGLSLRQPGNITPANSFCAGLGLSVSCLTCMGGAILYPLLIFVGTSTWYWGALILGTYSLALAVPMAFIAVAVGNWTWQFVHRPWLTRGLQWTSAVVMISVALLIAFDRTRVINSVVFSVLSALGGNPDPTFAKL
jgi:cytochrome c biogenesis protein CcdA